MGKNRIINIQAEIEEILVRFSPNRYLLIQALLQIVHRENIKTGNRIRRRYGEAELIPEPVMYQTSKPDKIEWIIDVPKSWTSLVSKDGKS